MLKMLEKLLVSEDGQGFMEYALIAALVVVGAIVAFKGLGAGIKTKINNVNTELGNAQPE
jgi:Flp pilus assembly pilin Flp